MRGRFVFSRLRSDLSARHRLLRTVLIGRDELLDGGADVEDISVDDGVAEITAAPEAFSDILKILEENKIQATESTITLIPENTTVISDINVARSVQKFLDALEDYDDAQEVVNDMELSDEVAEQLAAEEE